MSAPETPGHPPAPRRGLASRDITKWALRILISIGLVAVLIWRLPDVRFTDVIPVWTDATPWWLAAALFTQLAALALQAARWSAVLRLFERSLPFRSLLIDTLAGQFVSNVLPTSFGGDVVRVARSSRRLDDVPTAFASVAIERLVGWAVLPMISLTAIAISPAVRDRFVHQNLAIAIGIGTLIALSAILAVAATPAAKQFSTRDGWRAYIGAVHVGVIAMRRHPARLAGVLASGAAFQLMLCGTVWALGHAVGVNGFTVAVACAVFPVVAIAQNLPIGLGGVGVREGALVYFLAGINDSQASAISLGLAVYFVTVMASLLGAPAFARTVSASSAAHRSQTSDELRDNEG